MNRTSRLLALGAVLVIVIGALGYRLWSSQQFRARIAAARAHLEAGNPASAVFVLREFIQGGRQDEELLLIAAKAYRLMGHPEKSLEHLATADRLGYDSEEMVLERGLALHAVGRLGEAEPLLASLTTKDAVVGLAAIHLQLFEMQKALHDLDSWKRLDPKDPAPHVLSGQVWARVQQHEQAVEHFRQALQLDPQFVEAQLGLGASLAELGQTQEAAESLRKILDAQPEEPRAQFRLATCLVELGEVAEARELLEKLLGRHPHVPSALVELAKIEMGDGNNERAVELLERATRLDRNNDSAIYNHALVLMRLGRGEEAERQMAAARDIQESRRELAGLMDRVNADPADSDARCSAGEILLKLGDAQQAAGLFAAVLAREPDNAGARDGMARLNSLLSQENQSPR